MPHIVKTLYLGILAVALMSSCNVAPSSAPASSSTPADSFPLFDKTRNVLSFADTLDSVLPSVVRVENVSRNAEGRITGKGIGSGAVIDAQEGYVITNAHVVADGTEFTITIPDGRVVSAKLIGIDTPTDLAVLQADDLRVDAIKIGDSDALRVGDLVFAIGYPLGLEESLSLGIISALGRTASNTSLQDFIQTDAAINTGNSGGPLLDSQGRLIGVNAAIVSSGGGNIGIAYSIPSNLAVQVTNQLIVHGEVKRGAVGIEMTKVDEEASEKVGINHWDGALVASVRADSEAEQAGLQAGDVIVSFNGRKVKTPNALRTWIGVSMPGKPYPLTYIRKDGIETTVEIQVRAFKSQSIETLEQLGAFVRPTSAQDNIASHVSGVYVSRVAPNSPAERAGLDVGDVINQINDELVKNKHVCDRLVSEAKGRVRLTIYRSGIEMPLVIDS